MMKKINETKYPTETAKPSPSAAKQIETALPSIFSAVPIVATRAQVLQVLKYLLVYHKSFHQGNHHQCQLTTSLLKLRFLVDILTNICVEKIQNVSSQLIVLKTMNLVIPILWE